MAAVCPHIPRDSKITQSASKDTPTSSWSPPTMFECPPSAFTKRFDTPLPIMSRLPVSSSELDDTTNQYPSSLSDSNGDDISTSPTSAYLFPNENKTPIPGTLPYSESRPGLSYTVSRLPSISPESLALWTALHDLRPLTTTYTSSDSDITTSSSSRSSSSTANTCPFTQTSQDTSLHLIRTLFNWSSLALPLASSHTTHYGVVFRSARAPHSPSADLYLRDRLAHEEAVASGGLLVYFYGAPDTRTGVNLATCVWASREDARRASGLEMHRRAVEAARAAYTWFELSRYRVVKREGERGVRIERWEDEDD